MAFPAGAVPGIDVSHWQGSVDWEVVSKQGEMFGYAKASEGAATGDQYFIDNWSAMKTAGLLRGAYHFFHPNADAAAQADNFLNRLSKANGGSPLLAPGDLPPTLDIEVTDGASAAALLAGASTWLNAVQTATGRQPIVYTYVTFWKQALGNPADLSDYPLWIAHYNVPSPTIPGGWAGWSLWQFAQQPVPGVPGAVTDVDAFNGSYAALQALAGLV